MELKSRAFPTTAAYLHVRQYKKVNNIRIQMMIRDFLCFSFKKPSFSLCFIQYAAEIKTLKSFEELKKNLRAELNFHAVCHFDSISRRSKRMDYVEEFYYPCYREFTFLMFDFCMRKFFSSLHFIILELFFFLIFISKFEIFNTRFGHWD